MASLRSLAVLRRSLVVRTFHSTALRRGGPGPPLPAFKRSPPKWETVRIYQDCLAMSSHHAPRLGFRLFYLFVGELTNSDVAGLDRMEPK